MAVAWKFSGTSSRNRFRLYRCFRSSSSVTSRRSSGSLLFSNPGMRMTRARSKVVSTTHPRFLKASWIIRCHHWVARRACSRSSGVSTIQGWSRTHQHWRPWPLSMMSVGSMGSSPRASRASSRVLGSRSAFLWTGWATSRSAQKAGMPTTMNSLRRLLEVSCTPSLGAMPTPV